jgi:hypothetical protein
MIRPPLLMTKLQDRSPRRHLLKNVGDIPDLPAIDRDQNVAWQESDPVGRRTAFDIGDDDAFASEPYIQAIENARRDIRDRGARQRAFAADLVSSDGTVSGAVSSMISSATCRPRDSMASVTVRPGPAVSSR